MTPRASPGSHRWRWAALSILCVTLLLISLDLTILNVALPSIVRSLHATSSQLQWIVDAYAVAFAGLLLTLGALGDRVGRKWVFLAGLLVFAAGSAFSAFSGSVGWLTAGRVVMGAGAAALMPCTLSILTNIFSADRDRGRAIGIWSATAGLGVAIGPILGGFLLVHYWWGSVFLINVPIALLGGLAAIFLVPNSRNLQGKKLDPVGALLSIAGFGLLLWAIIEAPGRTWTAPPIIGALAASAALIAGFIVWEHHRTDPMLPVSFFRNRRYSAAIGSLALVIFALMGLLFLMTQYLQFVLGFSAFRAGLAIGPVALVLLVTAPFSAVLARRVGTKSVIVPGLLLIALGLGLLSQATVGDGYRWCLPFFLLIGCGVGLALAPSTDSVMGSVPKDEAGVGSATSDTSMQVGGAIGVAVLGTALNLRYQHLMSALIGHHAMPSAIHDVIFGSLGGALQVAARIPGPTGAALADAARRSFVSGMDLGLLIASIVVAAAACVVLLALPQRPSPPGTCTQPPGRLASPGEPPAGHSPLPAPRPPVPSSSPGASGTGSTVPGDAFGAASRAGRAPGASAAAAAVRGGCRRGSSRRCPGPGGSRSTVGCWRCAPRRPAGVSRPARWC
jgi:EmrB/QacA subfamily drug resistance transporter